MFAQWRCISVFSEVLDVATDVVGVDADALRDEVRSGRPRAEVVHQFDEVSTDRNPASPTLVLADGSSHTNPGIEMRRTDGPGSDLAVEWLRRPRLARRHRRSRSRCSARALGHGAPLVTTRQSRLHRAM
jgi:hypothetical protein